jgi:copper resistance protein B
MTQPPAPQTAPDPLSAAPYGSPVGDEQVYWHGVLDQFEGRLGGPGDAFRWEGEAWAGTDENRLWLKSEGTAGGSGRVSDGQQEAFYDRPITTYFDLQVGARYDLDSQPGRGWAAFGVEGLAPFFFNVAATAYVSTEGHYAAKIMGSYDLLITNRLILQPEAELNIYSKSDVPQQIGAGLSDMDAGLRLRYEITRKFAPYIGVAWEQKFAGSAAQARAAGESPHAVRLAFGIRQWF